MEWGSYIQGALGGLLIGLSAVTLMASLGRIAGISGMVSGLIFDRFTAESAWRLAFVPVSYTHLTLPTTPYV